MTLMKPEVKVEDEIENIIERAELMAVELSSALTEASKLIGGLELSSGLQNPETFQPLP